MILKPFTVFDSHSLDTLIDETPKLSILSIDQVMESLSSNPAFHLWYEHLSWVECRRV